MSSTSTTNVSQLLQTPLADLGEELHELRARAENELENAGATTHAAAIVEFYFNLGEEFMAVGRDIGDEEVAKGLFVAANLVGRFALETVERAQFSALLEQVEKSTSTPVSEFKPFIHEETIRERVRSGNLKGELKEVEKQRKNARKNLPSKYPNCDHSIPIHFLDAAKILLQEARELGRDRPKTAMGMVEAARYLVGNVERTYEENGFLHYYRAIRG